MNSKQLQPGHGYQLPPQAYHTDEWFQREQMELFPSVWNFVCTTDDVKEPGDYFATRVGPYPIAVIRSNDGQLNAFHNMCRHRGAQLLDNQGTCNKVICPYHRWQYSLDGELENVPQGDQQIPLLNKSDWGLLHVNVAVWMGMVFVNPDGKAPALVDWLDALPDHLQTFNLEDLTELAVEEYVFEANWKIYVENHLDWYHLWYTHAKTLSGLDHKLGAMYQAGPHWVSFEPYKDQSQQFAPFKPIAWLTDQARLNGAHLMFPNLTLFSGESWFGTGHLTPLAPNRTKMSFRLRTLPDQDPSTFLQGFHQVTQVEDAGVAKKIQATVGSPAFSVGPLTQDYELSITRFHDHYLAALSQ